MDFNFGSDVKELYESDKAQIRDVVLLMYNRYKDGKLLTPQEDAARRGQFAREVQERVAELGFVADLLDGASWAGAITTATVTRATPDDLMKMPKTPFATTAGGNRKFISPLY